MWLEAFVGPELVKHSGNDFEAVSTSSLAGKHVALYCSAKWCPPCQRFTPQLADLYEKSGLAPDKLEIIYLGMDRTESEWKEYYGKMPWLAVMKDHRDVAQGVMTKYRLMGIPSLLIFSPEGELLTTNGVAAVQGDPAGANFPWSGQKPPFSLPPGLMPLILLIIYFAYKWYTDKQKETE